MPIALFPSCERASPISNALVALESRSHRTEATAAFLRSLRVALAKCAGSSLKFCMIARGDADFYPRLGPTREWDTAAGHAILSAAGGIVTRSTERRSRTASPSNLRQSALRGLGATAAVAARTLRDKGLKQREIRERAGASALPPRGVPKRGHTLVTLSVKD